MAVEDWSTTASSNSTVGGINIAENCAPAGVNNALREIMAQIKVYLDGTTDASGKQDADATLTALAAITTAADKLIYATGSDAFSTTNLTSYGRTLIGLANAAALRTNIGAVTITGANLASPGYVKIDIGGTDLIIQWGTRFYGGNTSATVSYPISFASFGILSGSGGPNSASTEGDIHTTASGLSSGSILNSSSTSATFYWIAIGV